MEIPNTHDKGSSVFSPIYYRNYGTTVWERFNFKYGEEYCQCPSNIMRDLVFTEYQFRYQVQLVESMRKSTQASDDGRQIELERISRICGEQERKLYLKERALPAAIANVYHRIREDDRWYLRPLPVADCAAMGGCCARSCGCCQNRLPDLPKRGMSGHCSLACTCCDKAKGYSYDRDRISFIDSEYRSALESTNPALLARVADTYFPKAPPRAPTPKNERPPPYQSQESEHVNPGRSILTRLKPWGKQRGEHART